MTTNPKKRGRKPGHRTGPREGSASHRLSLLGVGQATWIDTTAETWDSDMRIATVPRNRRAAILAGREFRAKLYTCVGSSIHDVRYAIRLERIA